MKKNLQTGLILGMIILSGNAFGQANGSGLGKTKREQVTETYLDLVLNVVSTNLNYGGSNSALSDYKKSTLGAQVGVAFQAGITPKFSLASEFYFIMKGGELKANNPLTISKSTFRFYTLEFPVLARYQVGKFYVNAGPSIAYTLLGTLKTEGTTKDLSFANSNEGFKRWDAGIQTGAGYRFRVKQKRVALDVRYNYGLTNISYGQEMHNRNLIISLHISNPWKKNPFAKNKKS